MPSLEIDTSSDKDTIPHTMEKNISGIIISLREERNKSDTILNTIVTYLPYVASVISVAFKNIPKMIPKIIAIMIFFVKDIIILENLKLLDNWVRWQFQKQALSEVFYCL